MLSANKGIFFLNILFALLAFASGVCFEKYETLLFGMGMSFIFFILLPAFDVIYVLSRWKKGRFISSVMPILGYVAGFLIFLGCDNLFIQYAVKNTPRDPGSFVESNKESLEDIANELLGNSIEHIFIETNNSISVGMTGELPVKEISDATKGKLSAFGFREIWVDDLEAVVMFRFYHHRKWYEYFFTTNSQLPRILFPVATSESEKIDQVLGDGWYFRAW